MLLRARRWWVGLVALTVPLVLVLAGEWARWPFLQRPLEHFLSDRLGRSVAFGPQFGLQLLGPVRMASEDLHIAGRRPADAPLLEAGQVKLVLHWHTLLGLALGRNVAPLQVQSLDVGRLVLNLQRSADGRANWQFGPPDAPAAAGQAEMAVPRIGRLSLRDGWIHVDDALMALHLSAQVQTQEGLPQAGAAKPAGLHATARGDWRGQPLTAELHAAGLLPLADDADRSPPVPMRLQAQLGRAQLSLDGSVRDLLHLGGLEGRFELAGPSLSAVGKPLRVALPTTAPFKSSGHVRKSDKLWQVQLAALSVGSSRLAGEFKFDTAPAVPHLSGRLTGARLALPDLGPAFGAPAPGTPPAAKPPRPAGRVLPHRELDLPSLRMMSADVQVKLAMVDVGTALIAPLSPLQVQVRLEGGVLSLKDLQASSAGGDVRGDLSVDAGKEPPQWRADLRWAGVRLEQLVKLKNPRGGGQPYVSGQLAGHARLQGQGRSTARMLASLDGTTQLSVRAGRISHLTMELAGIDLAESLGLLLRGDEPLQMRCAVAQLALKDGRVTPQVAVMDTADTTLMIGGSLSLADESLALVVNASPHDFSPLTLRGPVRVNGSFAAPQVKLDSQRIGLRVAAAAALGALLSPLAAVLPLLDFGETDMEVCATALAEIRQRAAQTGGARATR
ncbi:AsmA family protein [Aquabacterium sp.]|uniref:AsmA family protein n=1 Tax=Aquabacterium sp. TaxID=1872578 RepID=UPI002BB06C5A|nr:AsmA family protein [Aquabacterium sp.]HSW04606.1 AsmA family protein [Aquabacterium sp.]